MKKSIISFILIFVVLAGAVPVKAASDTLTVNLLNAVDFLCNNKLSIVPSWKFTDSDEAEITWTTSIPYRCSAFILGVYSSSQITDISFNGVLGTLIGQNDTYYQFRFVLGEDNLIGSQKVNLNIRFENASQHNLNLVSFYGYQTNYMNFDQANYRIVKEYRVIDHSMLKTAVIEEVDYADIPFEKEYYMESWAGTPERLIYGITYAEFDPETIGVGYLDSLQVQFTFTGVSYHSARLVDKNTGETVQVLDYDYTHSAGDFLETIGGFSDYEVNLYHTCLNVDLDGIDLTDKYIQVVFAVEALAWAASTENLEGFFVRCDWSRAILPNEDLPWYTVWGNFIRDSWSGLFDWLEILEDAVASGFSNLIGKLATFFQDLTQSVSDWGQQIVDALSPDTSDLDQAADDMESAADDFGEANDILDSAGKPDVSDVEVDISPYIDVDGLGRNATFFTILVNQPTIKTMMILSLILCTAAYVLFGKR